MLQLSPCIPFPSTGVVAQQVVHKGLRVHGLHHGEGVVVQGRGPALRASLEI